MFIAYTQELGIFHKAPGGPLRVRPVFLSAKWKGGTYGPTSAVSHQKQLLQIWQDHQARRYYGNSTGANNPTLWRYVQPDDGIPGSNLYCTHWNQPTPGGQSVCVCLHRYSRYLEMSPPIRCRCGRIGGGTAAEAARAVCAASGALEPAKRARTNVPPI